MNLTFSNPRLRAEFADWPMGGSRRGPCVFQVHHDRRGFRVSRTTSGKPKFTTYGGQAVIVDGSNGKTYVLHATGPLGGPAVRIITSDLQHDAGRDELGRHSAYVRPDGADAELYQRLLALILAGNPTSLTLTPAR